MGTKSGSKYSGLGQTPAPFVVKRRPKYTPKDPRRRIGPVRRGSRS